MADAYGGVVNNWRVKNSANINATENGRVRIKTECVMQSVNGWSFAGLNVHGGASLNGQWATTDRTGVGIGTNGTVGLVAKEIWVNRGRSAQTVTCTAEVRVSGYAAGTSRCDIRINVPAKPSHTVSYNANGGSGAPGSQTKWWGEQLTLSNTRPSRANYTFLGWATSSGGNVAYQPGGKYGSDSNVTLYAKWKLNAKQPSIPSFTVARCDADGNADDTGSYAKLSATWKVDTAGDSSNACRSLKFGYQKPDGTWADWEAAASSGTSATTSVVEAGFTADQSWRFRVTLADKYATVQAYATMGPQRFVLDVTSDGLGIGIGMSAPTDGINLYGENGIWVNGNNLVPRFIEASEFMTFNSGYGTYNGSVHNISRCYCIQLGALLVFQIAVSGSFPNNKYVQVGSFKNDYMPKRSMNVSAAYNNGEVGTAFAIGETADGDYKPGGIFFGQNTGSTRSWAAATFIAFKS